MNVGDAVRVVYGEYQGKIGRVSSRYLHKRNNETWYGIQLIDENETIFFLDRYLQLISEQGVSYYPPASTI
jgi:hypothetical protein